MRGGNSKEKGRGKAARCSADLVPPNRGRGEENYSVREDNLIQLSQHQPSKSAIYGAFLLANSLYTKRKKIKPMQEMGREVQTRESEPAQQSRLGLLGRRHSLFSFQGSEAPTVLIIPIT